MYRRATQELLCDKQPQSVFQPGHQHQDIIFELIDFKRHGNIELQGSFLSHFR